MSNFLTEQEEFWVGEFGKEYIPRNQGSGLMASNLIFLPGSLAGTRRAKACPEFSANIGMSLKACSVSTKSSMTRISPKTIQPGSCWKSAIT
ncbi:hypothetical protein [Thiobacillus sp.]|jgi:hypothetical protein|uniref:hypothetical protein n=1 Tax=Thiobacillus sp. TaxID=924 RepID=UPI0025EF9C35|nr:hypothetical protein [Thiobacillus sp.]